ncbi:bacterial alpha-L-rhamnosidase family protein [Pseudarthrobacter siccitolerans]|uniref:Bacterial alpha-L-rhamnosidase family protein n=1 Tax=Pseudarthrobacter siccitolerans TaxID=861266 RepID=A0A024GWW4_9MICC|nr:alpha-L-rhamnosidase C-terminal domain-containing protein [Pseudarthrobacter siccitolerans]CCQ44440.1 bacterial alpha-L-rhamnosidase family protein [Pseudarthrobacter siccitolerans]
MASSPDQVELAPDLDDLPPNTDWQTYVPAPAQPDARPVAAIKVEGDVAGLAEFLEGTGDLVLTYRDGGPVPSVVLDYGTNVAGRPWFDVSRADAGTAVRVSYSESAHWAGPEGDIRGGHNASANRGRVEVLAINGPGRIDRELIQGGQRFQRLALETPGTVSLASVGIHFTAFRATPEQYQGWFVCSSDELTRIWYESAYTTQLNQLPADTLPIPWTVDDSGLRAKGGTLAVLRDAEHWTDVTATFETRIVDRAAGWVVRAADEGARGYLLTLRTPEEGRPCTLHWSYFDDGYEDRPQDTVRRYTELGSVELEKDLDPADWHRVRTSVEGPLLTVEIDQTTPVRVDLRELAEIPLVEKGSFGFHEAWDTSKVPGEHAHFRNLVVTAADGSEVFSHDLNDAEVLGQFIGDGVVSPDPLPVILDGARRDRSVWSGDLIVQIPNVFYTTAAADYVRGSIELLNSFQEPDGRLPARIPPLFPPAVPPQHGQVYSAVYSMHQVTNLALHHLYTGDLDFVRTQWPAVLHQLEYDHSLVDGRGLYVTNEDNGLDWDWYDGPKTGAVSAYNIVYCHVLRQASVLAAALGETTTAADLAARAENSRSAINEHLYDAQRRLYVLSDLHKDAVAQDANALAVVHGIARPEDAADILAALDQALPQTPFGPEVFDAAAGFQQNVSPYTSGFHLGALFEAGLTDRAIKLLRDLWGHMAAPGPYASGTVWELLETDGTPGFGVTTSLAHGWACAPTVALSSYVLGITPRSTAFRTWSIAPQTGPLTWARGQVPTPDGPLEVSWKREGSALNLDVVTPGSTSGAITVPGAVARLRGVTNGGEHLDLTQASTNGAATISFDIQAGGRYTVESELC